MMSFKSNLSSDLENAKNAPQNWTGLRPIRSEFLTYILGDGALACTHPNERFGLHGSAIMTIIFRKLLFLAFFHLLPLNTPSMHYLD